MVLRISEQALFDRLLELVHDERGASMVEHALVLVMLLIGVGGAVGILVSDLGDFFQRVSVLFGALP